jgi:hypothetical protein
MLVAFISLHNLFCIDVVLYRSKFKFALDLN